MENKVKVKGNADIKSVSAKALREMLAQGLVREVDPGDGEPHFYVFTEEFDKLLLVRI